MKKLFTATTMLLFTCGIFAQVGIGTTTPTAALEIKSPTDNLPALELNPQTSPIGSASGQLSVIGDQLYLYDAQRIKWLSVESANFNFGREGKNDDKYLEYSGDIDKSGPRMLRTGTIVYVSMNSSGGNNAKTGAIEITNSSGAVSSTPIALIGGRRIYDNLNIDFESGDQFRVHIGKDGNDAKDVSVLIWVKWRN